VRNGFSRVSAVGLAAFAVVVAMAMPVGAAITAPSNGATVAGTITISDNGAQSAGCSDLGGVSTSNGQTTMYVDQGSGTAQGTVVNGPLADSGTSTVDLIVGPGSTNSTNPASGSWVTDNYGNGTYTLTSLEQAAKSTFGIVCSKGTLTTARETLNVSNTGVLTYGGATTGAPGQTVTVKATLVDQNNIAPANGQVVTFSLPGQAAVTAPTTNGVASTTLTLVGPPRSVTMTISSPATYFTAASTTQSFVVTKDPTTTTLSPPASTDYGQTATFSATVASQIAGQGTPTGSVQFTEDNANVGSPQPVNGSGVATLSDASLAAGSHTIGAVYIGDSNFSTSTATPAPLTVATAPTVTGLVTSVQPSFFGEAITYTATVTATSPGPDTGAPTGTVSFLATPTGGGSATPVGGAVTLVPVGPTEPNTSTAVSTSISLLPAGSYTSSAQYNPTPNYHSSNSSTPQTVNPAQTAVTVTSTLPTFSDFGQSVQFTATVATQSPGHGSPTGSITFVADAGSPTPTNLGTVTLNPAGADSSSATSPATASLSPGLHVITATYTNVDGNYESGTAGTVQQFVAPDASTTTISTLNNANPSVFGQPVQFQATVTLAFTDAGTPTGVVLFYINGNDPPTCSTTDPGFLGVVSLVNGVATTAPISNLAVGNNTISACYDSSSSDFGASSTQDPQYVQVVNPDPTTTLLTSANQPGGASGPSVFGQPVTFTASVTANAPGAGIPLGSITFTDGANTLGTVPLSGGSSSDTAALTTAALSVGNHAIQAVYNPTGPDFLTSNAALNQTVNQAQTTTTITQNGQSVQGQSVTFTATIAPVAPGAGNPTGTVEFEINGADIFGGPVAVVPGSGESTATSPPIAALTPGTYQATAIYSGDVDFLTSNDTIGQIVNPASTSTSLVASPNPDTFGTPVSLTATVTPTGAGTGLPTGSVDFYDGPTLLGAVALSTQGGAQVAVLPAQVYAVGAHAFSAVYLGEYDYSGSTSNTANDTVSAIGTTTTLSSSSNPSAYSTSVTFTATVTPTANTGPGASGTVTFTDGSSVLATVPVAASGTNFVATFTTSSLAAGPHSISASYSGTSDYSASASSALTQTVNKDGTSLAAQNASENTMTATLTTAQHNPLAGQTLTFTAGTTTLCTAVTGANGVASCKATGSNGTTLQRAGSYTVTYAGNASYLGSSATALAHP